MQPNLRKLRGPYTTSEVGRVVSDTYSDVDASSNIDEAIERQERIDQWPAIASYEEAMDVWIGETAPLLDIGAGPGRDAARNGAVGLNRSHAMVKRAASHGIPVLVGDAHCLLVGDRTMAGVRSDRVLQHLAEPRTALEEMFRGLRPGRSPCSCRPGPGDSVDNCSRGA